MPLLGFSNEQALNKSLIHIVIHNMLAILQLLKGVMQIVQQSFTVSVNLRSTVMSDPENSLNKFTM